MSSPAADSDDAVESLIEAASSMQPPPSNQNFNMPRQERAGEHLDIDTGASDSDVASGRESPSVDGLAYESEEEEGLPEKAWVRRQIETLSKSVEFKELMQEWDSTEVDYKSCMDRTKRQERKQILENFEEETVRLFVDRHLRFLTEPVVQTYIQKVLAVLGRSREDNIPLGFHCLSSAVLEGRRGLCWYTFYTILNPQTGTHATRFKPKLHEPRPNGVHNTKDRALRLATSHGTNWIGKLDEIFCIEDDKHRDPKQRKKIRKWDDYDFRQKARRLAEILSNDLKDHRLATHWRLGLGRMASQYLWAVPLFTKDSIAKPPYIDGKTLNPTVDIILPTLSSRYIQNNEDFLRLQEGLLEKEIYFWLSRQPKGENDNAGMQQSMRVNLQGESNKVQQLRQRRDVIDPERQEALLKRTREIYCDPIRLFCEMQNAASCKQYDMLVLDPEHPYDSPEGAKTIGLEGRNQQSMIAHIRALHPSWSRSEAEQTLYELTDNVKDLGSTMGYMTRNDFPIIDINARRGRVLDVRCRGALLFPSFGDIMHLKEVDKYTASLREARGSRSRQTTPYDSGEERREGTTGMPDEEAFAQFAGRRSQKRRRLSTEESDRARRGEQDVEADRGSARSGTSPLSVGTEIDVGQSQADVDVLRVGSSEWDISHTGGSYTTYKARKST